MVVANIGPRWRRATLAAGNAKVLSARLSDARFFWTEDRKTPLEDRLEKLKGVTFHAKLGTMFERVERIEALAREIAPLVGADPDLAAKAARLAKADLGTGMVGEFPELQGIMGGYYARAEGLEPEVADAVRDHYKPVGPSDTVPTAAGHRRRGPGRQARHPGGLLRHRREADRLPRPVCAEARGVGGDPASVVEYDRNFELRNAIFQALTIMVRARYSGYNEYDLGDETVLVGS